MDQSTLLSRIRYTPCVVCGKYLGDQEIKNKEYEYTITKRHSLCVFHRCCIGGRNEYK